MTTVEFCVGVLGWRLGDVFDRDREPTAVTIPSDVPGSYWAVTIPSDVPGSYWAVSISECDKYVAMPLEEIPLYLAAGDYGRFDKRGRWWSIYGAILTKRLELGI